MCRVHDIIKIKAGGDYLDREIPAWAKQELSVCPYVVVRRGRSENDRHISAGIRGAKKEQRFACELKKDGIEQVLTPRELLHGLFSGAIGNPSWREALAPLQELMQWKNEIRWIGIGGSVGFELATGRKVTTEKSDADLLLSLRGGEDGCIEKGLCLRVWNYLKELPVTADPLLVTREGWVSLKEYAKAEGRVLVKTQNGCELQAVLTEERRV